MSFACVCGITVSNLAQSAST